MTPSQADDPRGPQHRLQTVPPLRLSNSRFDIGRNCWKIEQADRVSFLIDGAAYFSAFREAAMHARHCILILGWDFDSRIRMLPDRQTDELPNRLGEFLHHLLARRKQLRVYVLTWDFHMIYWREREWWLPSKLSAHRRLHFLRDGAHPIGASHHQKIVVVDDAVAFVGGMDFAACRWDTPSHEPDHPARRASDGRPPCRPFHDVQIMVDGPSAAALGELARDRWRAASGTSIPFTPPVPDGIWPPRVRPDLADVRVAIARTAPRFGSRRPVAEVETLFVDSLRAARRHVYIETQYLTSRTIANCLVERLRDPRGPELVLIVHPNSDGWLEQHTMDVLRSRIVKRLRAADRFGRLGLYYPRIPGLHEGINVHSKVCIIDDELVRVGSANLSNRSMRFDTECDLAIEAEGRPAVRRGIANFRNALLGEHLGVSGDAVRRELKQDGSLIGAVERLRGGGRSLASFDETGADDIADIVPDAEFVDPSLPYEAQLFPIERRKPAQRHFVKAGIGLLVMVLLAALWQWAPVREWLDVQSAAVYLDDVAAGPVAPLAAVAGFVVGGLLVVPVVLLIAVSVLAFGPWWGFVYALTGMTLSAVVTFGIGRLLGRTLMDHLSGSRLYRVSRALAAKGILAVVVLRLLPVAPFSIVNAVAGASHIRFRDFFFGTLIGELPGLVSLALFVEQVLDTVRHPGLGSLGMLAAIGGLLILALMGISKWVAAQTHGYMDR